MRMRRITGLTSAVLATVLATALLAVGCGGTEDDTPAGGGKPATGGTTGKGTPAQKGGQVTIGLAEDPDQLDPTLARTFVGRTIFVNMCEKLYDLDEKLQIVPQLASALPDISEDGKTVTIKLRDGIKFNDGTAFDADAVKTSLDRHRKLKESSRASELAPVTSVDVVDPSTVRLKLKQTFAPLTAQLADRAGMIMSPKQLDKLGDKFANDPVCVGPFAFSQRTESDRIVLERAKDYYDADKVNLDKLTFKVITEPSARASNLRTQDINVADRLEATDLKTIQSDPNLQVLPVTSLGYEGITINIANTDGVGKPPKPVDTALSKNPKLRQAFDLSLDRNSIAKVVYANQVVPGCGPISPVSPWHDASLKCPARDIEKAKQLVADSGVPTPVPVTLIINTDAVALRLGQVIQAMTKEAGFAVKLQPTEFTSALDKTDAGQYDAFEIGWSGRVDPDGNIYQFTDKTGSLNIGSYSNPKLDDTLDQARATNDRAQRTQLYKQAVGILNTDHPLIYLFHEKYLAGAGKNVVGMKVFGDGLMRFKEAGLAAK
jgi:peptide/nickel transport system substrate-binding protein